MPALAVLALTGLAGCRLMSEPVTTPSARPLFGAYGGVGVIPVPTPPDFETVFVVVVVELVNPTDDAIALAVDGLTLVDEGGATQASLRRIDRLELLDDTRAAPGPTETGSWAYYLNPVDADARFGGTLHPGRVRLRIRASLDRSPRAPTRFRLTLRGLPAPMVEGKIAGSWPT